MKFKVVHVVMLVLGVCIGAVGYRAYHITTSPSAPTAAPAATAPASAAQGEDKFLEKTRELAQNTPQAKEEGAMPPTTIDPTTAPVIELEPTGLFDMGTVARDKPTTGEFKVHNKGKGTLQINQVSSSCGCTKATIDPNKKLIAPGEYSVISVTVDPKRISGAESRKTVTVTSNDPKTPRVMLDVLAKIDPEYMLEPNEIDFGEMTKGAVAEKTAVLRQLLDEPIELLEVKMVSKTPGLELSFVKRPESEWAKPGHNEYTITARLLEDVSPGQFTGRFIAKTTCQRMPDMSCNVKAKVKSFYSIAPGRQLMVRGGGGMGASVPPVTAVITSEKPFELQDLAASSDMLVVASKPGNQPNSMAIEVSVKPEASPGTRDESITFTLKAADEVQKDRLPVRMVVSPAPKSPIVPTSPDQAGKVPAPPAVNDKPGGWGLPQAAPSPTTLPPAGDVPAPPAAPADGRPAPRQMPLVQPSGGGATSPQSVMPGLLKMKPVAGGAPAASAEPKAETKPIVPSASAPAPAPEPEKK